MKDTDIAWAAGFFEGEGSLALQIQNSGGYAGHISASQQSREPLDELQRLFGGNVHRNVGLAYTNKGVKKLGYPFWVWRLSRGKSLPFLEAILPYIKSPPRRAEMKMFLKFHETTNRDHRMRVLCWWVGRKARFKQTLLGGT